MSSWVHSWPAWDRWVTPSAASSALSCRRCATLAAMLTKKPAMASSAAAMATASTACCGAADSGLPSRPAASWPRLVTDDPAGSSAASPGGAPPAVASHQLVTGTGGSPRLSSACCTAARSRMSAPPEATVGNECTAATMCTATVRPLTLSSTVAPTSVLLAARKDWVAMAGMAATEGAAAVSVSWPKIGSGGWPRFAGSACP